MATSDGNRLDYRTGNGSTQADIQKYSADGQVRTYEQTAPVVYNESRVVSSIPDAAPSTVASTEWISWRGYMSLLGYPVLTGGSHVDITLWVPDRENNALVKVATASNVTDGEEFSFDGLVRGRDVYLQISAQSGGVTAATLRIARQ